VPRKTQGDNLMQVGVRIIRLKFRNLSCRSGTLVRERGERTWRLRPAGAIESAERKDQLTLRPNVPVNVSAEL